MEFTRGSHPAMAKAKIPLSRNKPPEDDASIYVPTGVDDLDGLLNGNELENLSEGFEKEIADRNKVIRDLRADAARQENLIRDLRTEATKKDNTIRDLRAGGAKQATTIRDLRVEVTKRDNTIRDLGAEVAKRDDMIRHLKQSERATVEDGTISALRDQVAQHKTDVDALEERVKRRNVTIDNLNLQVATQKSTIASLNQQITAGQGTQRPNDAQEKAELKAKVTELEQKLERALKQNESNLDFKKREQEEAERLIRKLQGTIKSRDQEIKRLNESRCCIL
jgi:chromosome segregation ATPase